MQTEFKAPESNQALLPAMIIPVILCIDVEPDLRTFDRRAGSTWSGFAAMGETLNDLRTRMCIRTHAAARFNWFLRMDPQIQETYGSAAWITEVEADRIGQLAKEGDEFGLHVHAWRFDSRRNIWIADFADQSWIDHCVRMSVDAYQRRFECQCRVFRFGDRWLNNATVDLLEELGVRCDLTIEPGLVGGDLPESFTGSIPDYSLVPTLPYQPSRQDIRVASAGRKLWMIPVSAGNVHWPSDNRFDVPQYTTQENAIAARRVNRIVANPNPVLVDHWPEPGQTALSWSFDGADEVEVRVGSPDGPLFCHTASPGTAQTGKWVTNGMVFYLQNVTADRPLSAENTLAVARVAVHPRERPDSLSEASGRSCMTLNLAFEPLLFRRVMNALLTTRRSPYLAIVARSDCAFVPRERTNLLENLETILNHPLADDFRFVSPQMALAMIECSC
jgi:hypothetical protein